MGWHGPRHDCIWFLRTETPGSPRWIAGLSMLCPRLPLCLCLCVCRILPPSPPSRPSCRFRPLPFGCCWSCCCCCCQCLVTVGLKPHVSDTQRHGTESVPPVDLTVSRQIAINPTSQQPLLQPPPPSLPAHSSSVNNSGEKRYGTARSAAAEHRPPPPPHSGAKATTTHPAGKPSTLAGGTDTCSECNPRAPASTPPSPQPAACSRTYHTSIHTESN